jgi:hypothetical protein
MSKNLQATFWAALALLSVIVGVWAIKRQLPARPVSKTAINKVSKPTSIAETLTNIFFPNVATTQTPVNILTTADIATSTVTTNLPRRKPKPVAKQMSYGDAVVYYGNNRIQFGSSCEAIPNRMAVANPVTLMLDNRSAGPQKIVIAGKTYNVADYNYVVVTIKEKTLPVHLFVNCNSSVNVAEIILE